VSTPDELITTYLRDLEAATADLPSAARADLLSDLRDHLEEVRRSGGEVEVRDALDRLGTPAEIAASARETEGVAVRGPVPPPPPAAMATRLATTSAAGAGAVRSRSPAAGLRDTWTVVLLLLGPIALAALLASLNRSLLVLGLVAGIALSWSLLWTSPTWTTAEKVLGTAVWPGGFVLPLALMSVATSVCTETVTVIGDDGRQAPVETVCEGFSLPLWLGLPTAALTWLAPLVVGGFLLHRGSRRRAQAGDQQLP
jgi:hypothetical protein